MSVARHSEGAFETVIEAHLLQDGYVPIAREGFDRERAIFPETGQQKNSGQANLSVQKLT
jgi:type I restriction enzyme R subunit